MKITYSKCGNYYLPDLTVGATEHYQIGKYGRLHEDYIKKYRRACYSQLILNGTLYKYLYEIDQTCHKQVEQTVKRMADAEGVNENLKATDQMKWVGLMNNFRHCAEEIIYSEIVYAEVYSK